MDVWAETGLEDRSGVARVDLSVVGAWMVEVPLREAQGNRKVLSASSFLVMKLTNMCSSLSVFVSVALAA